MDPPETLGFVYVLMLMHKCWYVGFARTVELYDNEIKKHKKGGVNAAKWIQHRPVVLVAQFLFNVPQSKEADVTKQLMEEYGVDFVRGCPSAVDKDKLPRSLRNISHEGCYCMHGRVCDPCLASCCGDCCKMNHSTEAPSCRDHS